MNTSIKYLTLSLIAFLGGFNLAFTQSVPTGFKLEKIISGLNPVAMTIDPFGRIWVAEKHGEVLIFENGKALKDPFITLDVDAFNERGLLGIALHPDYVSNGYVYIYYTVPNEALNRVIRVKSNGDHAIPGSERVIIELDKLSGDIHNGGAMVFDSTGHLFIGTGDGSNGPRGAITCQHSWKNIEVARRWKNTCRQSICQSNLWNLSSHLCSRSSESIFNSLR